MYNSFGKYKLTSQVQIFLGLCLTCCFILCSSSNFTFALDEYDQNLYPIKSSRILSEDISVSKDNGISDANFSLLSSNVSGGLLYVDHVLNLVDNALTHVDSYFTQHVSYSYPKSDLRTLLVSKDNGYFVDRDYFLNVYLVVDSNYNGEIWFQYNYGYLGFHNMPYDVIASDNTTISYHFGNYSSLNFASVYLDSSNEQYDYVGGVFNSNDFVFSNLKQINQLYNYDGFSQRYSFSDFYDSLFTSSLTQNRFFKYYDSTDVTIRRAMKGKYILPLYIDSDIYFPLSFVSEYNSSYTIHGYFDYDNGPCMYYSPALGSINKSYFDSNLWYAGEFQSGIKGTTYPDPIVTPIPTFGPIYTPTPFPSININATLTPIAIPNDPYISVANADPISTVVGIFSYLMTMFATPFFGFVKYTLQYIYNSSVYWQILLFLIPGVVLIAFLIGRLKRK